MADFPTSQRAAIQRSLDAAEVWLDKLLEANSKSFSDIRATILDELSDLIVSMSDFLTKSDFSTSEIEEISAVSASLDLISDAITDSNELIMMELGGDLADLVLKLGHRAYSKLLKVHWISMRRYNPLPWDPPEDVQDEFNIHLFNLVQNQLNLAVVNSWEVRLLGCLTPDDYDTRKFSKLVSNQSLAAAIAAGNSYLQIQSLKAQAAAAQQQQGSVSVLGQIWDVVGWDSPMDLLTDLGLAAVTGGIFKAGKFYRKFRKAKKAVERTVDKAEELLGINNRLAKIQDRQSEIKKAADALKRTRQIADLPNKLVTALKILENADAQLVILQEVRAKVTKKLMRDASQGWLSSNLSRATGYGEVNLGTAASFEAANQSIKSVIDGWPPWDTLKSRRSDANLIGLFTTNSKKRYTAKLIVIFGFLVTRDLITRLAINIARKQGIDQKIYTAEVQAAFGSAAESMILDCISDKSKLKSNFVFTTFISSVRKIGVGIAQKTYADWQKQP